MAVVACIMVGYDAATSSGRDACKDVVPPTLAHRREAVGQGQAQETVATAS